MHILLTVLAVIGKILLGIIALLLLLILLLLVTLFTGCAGSRSTEEETPERLLVNGDDVV